MTSSSPIPPETASLRSESVTSTRDSASLLAEYASQAIVLLQKAEPHTVVTGLLKEKAYLHSQNGQLWRLVDKQRAALLDLQKDYQKVLQEKNKYQARLKSVKAENLRPSDQNSVSTESSGHAVQDGEPEVRQSPSRRSSARSARQPWSPRSPHSGAQLDALQASLEEEIGKSSDDPDSGTSIPDPTETKMVATPPALILNESSGEEATMSSKAPKRVPTPLRLTPERVQLVSIAPQSAFLVPRSESFEKQGGPTTFREPPPSAPPYQTSLSTPFSPTERNVPPPMFSPGLPASPRPVSLQPLVSTSTRTSLDASSTQAQGHRSPSTSKGTTDTDDSTDSSASPHTPAFINPPKQVYVEAVRMSPVALRRARIPSHRSNPSASSSVTTINEITSPSSPVMARRSSRSMSVDLKPRSEGGLLAPPDEMLERRRSRSFEDLHRLSTAFDEMRTAHDASVLEEKKQMLQGESLTSMSLDETIQDLQNANEEAKAASINERSTDEIGPEQPKRPAPATPSPPSPMSFSPTSLQPPQALIPGRARTPSYSTTPVTLLISPEEIHSIVLSVLSVRSRKITNSDGPAEESLFTIRCRTRPTPDKAPETEILRVEKSLSQLEELSLALLNIVGMSSFISTFFAEFPIEKSGQRKAVDYFLKVILGSQLDASGLRTVAEFLSTDIVKKHDPELLDRVNSQSTVASTRSPTKENASSPVKDQAPPKKEGYLTKRGKNFGGWQTRYFVLDSPQLKYFDAPNGVHLGSIKLPQAQIGRQTIQSQSNNEESGGDEQMKFAFLILEPKRNDVTKMVRHVLCSQSEEERDEWINAILYYVALDAEPSPQAGEKARGKRLQRRTSDVSKLDAQRVVSPELGSDQETVGIRYDQTAAGKRPATSAAEPRIVEPQRQSTRPTQTPQEDGSRGIDPRLARSPQPHPVVPQRSPYRQPISGPMNGAPITDESAWTSVQREEERRREEKRVKKRSVWGFLSKGTGRLTPDNIQPTAPPPPALLQHGLFGIPLQEAVDITCEMGMGINVPSVVYRTIEYLEHMDAAKEEGIYRLSGSNSAIRMLKDKFNGEGDVDLVNSRDYHDVHAVAGLLKLYLRELPSTVLTRDRHADFLHIVDIEDKAARVRRLSDLVRGLPKVNYELLRVMSKHLKRIVARSQENKMTIRNVGIVFSPTLNIPAPVFSLFITEYEFVFDEPDDTPMAPSPTATPPTDPPYGVSNERPDSAQHSHPNHHLNVHEHSSHRRYHSADPPARRGTPPASFPVHPHQGYQDSTSRQPGYLQPQPQYPQQQQSYQQSYQQQAYRQYLAPQPTYAQAKWGSGRDDADLFG